MFGITSASANNYGIFEIERHLHSCESWFETATLAVGETHVADRIGNGAGAFQIDADNDDWGSWVQILGSNDTPARSTDLYFDLNTIQIEAAERTATYFIQLTAGESGAIGYAADYYTEFVFRPATVQGKPAPIYTRTRRCAVGTKVWARCMCPGQNTATLDFYIGLHGYER